MTGPYGFEMSESCESYKLRGNGFFSRLSQAALQELDGIKFVSAYPQNSILYMENQAARGIYVLLEGEVKLSVSSSEGKTLIQRIAKPGDVLGLQPALSNTPQEMTAETLRPVQVAFIRRDDFMRFLAKYPDAYGAVLGQMAAHYQSVCQQLRTIGLCSSAHGKLAKLLLDLSDQGKPAKDGTRVRLSLTREQIGECIGAARETVSRTITQFKNDHLIELRGAMLTIQNRSGLEQFINS